MRKQAVIFNGQEVGIAVAVDNRRRSLLPVHIIDLDNCAFDR